MSLRIIALIMLAFAALAGSGRAAFAHATLIASDPADNSVAAAAPKSFSLTFNQPVAPLVVRLIGPEGRALALERIASEAGRIVIEAPSGLGSGTHALSWRVISQDGHPVSGTVVFSIGAPSAGGAPDAAISIDRPLAVALWSARLTLYAALFFGLGAALFGGWIGPVAGRVTTFATGLIMLGLVAAAISIGLQGADALGTPLGGLRLAAIWRTGFDTSYSTTAIAAMLALIAGLAALHGPARAAGALSLAGLIAAGLALAASGHAATAAPQWLTRPAVFAHVVGVGLWAGSLLPLAMLARSPDTAALAAALRRFSRAIPLALLALIAAGLALAMVQLGSIEALWTTAYGKVLLIKLVLVAALFALAVLNRYRLTQPALAGDLAAIGHLRRSILAEAALVLAIFGAVALWRFTPPPRALAEAAAAPAATHIHTAKAMADLTITPGRAGQVAASMIIMTGDYAPLDAKEVTLSLANPAAGIEPVRREATRPGDGSWAVNGLSIPAPGRWSVRIDILVSDFEQVTLKGEIDIRR
jgi:copper transport protein